MRAMNTKKKPSRQEGFVLLTSALVVALLLIGIVVAISMWRRLDLERSVVWATIRATVQLIAVGLLFTVIFESAQASLWAWLWVVAMVLISGVVAYRRAPTIPNMFTTGLLAIGVTVALSLAVVFGLGVLDADPVAVVVIERLHPFVEIEGPTHGKVCETDIEPLILRDENITREVQALIGAVQHGDLNRARARLDDLLGDEVAIHAQRDLAAKGCDGMSFWDMVAIDGHRAAMNGDVAHSGAIIAIAGKLGKGRFRAARVIDAVLSLRHLQRQWYGLVKAAMAVIDPQGVAQVFPKGTVL